MFMRSKKMGALVHGEQKLSDLMQNLLKCNIAWLKVQRKQSNIKNIEQVLYHVLLKAVFIENI